MKARSVVLAIMAMTLVMPLYGCQQVKSALTPEAPVITQEATAAATGAAIEGEIPPEFPDDVPLWPGATVTYSQSNGASDSLILATEEKYDDVVAGVAVGFERAGWETVELSQDASATALEVSNNAYDGLITVYSNAQGVTIEYLMTSK